MIEHAQEIPLEDELGDVLDKAMRLAHLTADDLANKADIELSRLLDALDWRSELKQQELENLAKVLNLNEVGLCALAFGNYPKARIEGLPFCLHHIHMPHGIGVANAYLIGDCCSSSAILFDTGGSLPALLSQWPARIKSLEAVFVSHMEPEHSGALLEVLKHFNIETAFCPAGAQSSMAKSIGDGFVWQNALVKVSALNTPGHCAAHNAYVVENVRASRGRKLLISGDILFAGSVGCAFYCHKRLFESVNRVLGELPEDTLVAPGHGPITTIGTERRFNPFSR
jgi:hydroxyacylglutathione hydrolase